MRSPNLAQFLYCLDEVNALMKLMQECIKTKDVDQKIWFRFRLLATECSTFFVFCAFILYWLTLPITYFSTYMCKVYQWYDIKTSTHYHKERISVLWTTFIFVCKFISGQSVTVATAYLLSFLAKANLLSFWEQTIFCLLSADPCCQDEFSALNTATLIPRWIKKKPCQYTS